MTLATVLNDLLKGIGLGSQPSQEEKRSAQRPARRPSSAVHAKSRPRPASGGVKAGRENLQSSPDEPPPTEFGKITEGDVLPKAILTENLPSIRKRAEPATSPSKPAGLTALVSKGRENKAAPAKPEALPLPERSTGVTEEQKAAVLAYRGDILTGTAAIPVSDATKKLCAFFANGWFVVEENSEMNPLVMTMREDILRKNHKITQVIKSDLQTIRLAYRRVEQSSARRTVDQIDGVSVQYFQKLFFSLIAEGAARRISDMHVFVHQHEADIYFRVNGLMTRHRQEEAKWAHSLCSAAFSMADASDSTYKPMEFQGARVSSTRTPLAPGVQSIRLQFNPLPNGGRYMVCRLLYESSDAGGSDLDSLGYNQCQMQQLKGMRRQSYGINIIAGPTGSGKSTTLVRALTALMHEKPGINIITIEDPPEYVIKGVAQLPVTNATSAKDRSEAFTKAISASLRSDPDVIMIGEIRDNASASLAFEAAMTGHQVYASLHANTAASILTRLRDIKVEVYKLTDPTFMTGLIGQRLMRRLCDHCKTPFADATEEMLITQGYDKELIRLTREIAGERIKDVYVANPDGCEHCRGGIAGRVVIAETIRPDEKFMNHIRNEQPGLAIKYWLDECQGLTMQEHAIQKMTKGMAAPLDVEAAGGDFKNFLMDRKEIVFGPLYE